MTDTPAAPTASPRPAPPDASAASGRLGRPADLRRGREHRADLGRHPRGAPGRRRCSSSTTSRPTGPAGWPTTSPRPTRASVSATGRSSRAWGAPISMASGSRWPAGRPRSSRWTPTSATIRRHSPALVAPIADGTADLVIGSRYTKGGGVVDWGIGRRIVSRGGSIFARIVLGLGQNDLTGGFKAWRAATLARGPVRRRPRRRLRLPDRDDLPGQPRRGAHPRGPDHVPRPTRRASPR